MPFVVIEEIFRFLKLLGLDFYITESLGCALCAGAWFFDFFEGVVLRGSLEIIALAAVRTAREIIFILACHCKFSVFDTAAVNGG